MVQKKFVPTHTKRSLGERGLRIGSEKGGSEENNNINERSLSTAVSGSLSVSHTLPVRSVSEDLSLVPKIIKSSSDSSLASLHTISPKKWIWVQIGLNYDPIKISVPSHSKVVDLQKIITNHEEFVHYLRGSEARLVLYHVCEKTGKLDELRPINTIRFDVIGEDIILVQEIELSLPPSDPLDKTSSSNQTSPISTSLSSSSPQTLNISKSKLDPPKLKKSKSITLKRSGLHKTGKVVDPDQALVEFLEDPSTATNNPLLLRLKPDADLGKILREMLHSSSGLVKDRKQGVLKQTQKQCMVGSEIVEWLVKEKYGDTIGKAIEIGHALVLFHMLTNVNEEGGPFKNENVLFRSTSELEEEIDFKYLLSSPSLVETTFNMDHVKLQNLCLPELKQWLLDTNQKQYIDIFEEEHSTNSSTELSNPKDPKKMFTIDKNHPNMIILERATKDQSLDFFLANPYMELGHIFDVEKFVDQVLCTFPAFMSCIELLQFLVLRFNSSNTSLLAKERILVILNYWINIDNGFDFQDEKMVVALKEFTENIASVPQERFKIIAGFFSKKMHKIIQDKKERAEGKHIRKLYVSLPPEPILPINKISREIYDCGRFPIAEIDPLELARQITLITEEYMLNMTRHEFLKENYDAKHRKQHAPSIYNMLEFAEHLSGVCTAEVLKEPLPIRQAELYTYFVNVTEELRKLNNFFGVGCIVGALNGPAITKLKKMAKNLDSKIIKKYEVLKNLVVPNLGEEVDYYNEAVEALRQNDPFIPLLHSRLGLGALTQLDQIYKDIIKDTENPSGLINWYKLGRVAKIINYIKQIRPGYSLREVLPIQKAIFQAESWRYENINCRISELRNNIDSLHMESQLKREETSRLWDPEWIGLNDEDWSTIITATSAQCCDFKKDELLLDHKGDEVHPYFYRLVSGSVNIINKVEGGKELPTNLRLRQQLRLMPIQRMEFSLQAQNIFGELSFFGKPSPCEVVALTNGVIYIIEIEKMIQFCLRTDGISRKFNRYLAWKAARRLKRKMENSVTRRMSTDGTGAKKPINIEEKMLKDVTLGENEKILKEYRCARLKKQVKFECLFIVTGQKFMFNCKMFGIRNTVIKPISLVQKIEVKDKTLFVDNIIMKDFEGHNINTVYDFITALWEREKMVTEDKRKEYEQKELTQTTPLKRNASLMLDEADWKLITRGAQMLSFNNEEVIIEKGHISTKLYQILNGTVQEQNILTNGKADYIKVLGKGDLFGEVAFLSNRQASVSVVALQKTQVLVIEGYYLSILFQHDPSLAGRFFHHLAGIMSERLFEAGYF